MIHLRPLPNKFSFFHTAHERIINVQYRRAIELAYRMAKEAHRPQTRDNDERYFNHVKAVACIILYDLNVYDELELTILLICALLHDTIEDSFMVTKSLLHFIFDQVDPSIATTIDVLSKPDVADKTLKMAKLLADETVTVRIVKGCDNLHNQRTLRNCPPSKMRKNIKETLEVIIPWMELHNENPQVRFLVDRLREAAQENRDYLATLVIKDAPNA